MTAAILTWTLDDELEVLARGEVIACLVCGEPVETVGERVECPACGAVVEPSRAVSDDQLALL